MSSDSPKSVRKEKNALDVIHILFNDFGTSFRNRVIKDLEISRPSYYRRRKVLSEAEKQKVVRIALRRLRVLTKYIQRKYTTSND